MSVDAQQLQKRIDAGEMIETLDEMSSEYRAELRKMLIVAGDTEYRAVPMLREYFSAGVPRHYARPLMSIIQDEIGHAHVNYRLLEVLGEDLDALMFGREPEQWVYPFLFDMPVDNWYEAAVIEGLAEFCGGLLVRNIYNHTSYGPWNRSLSKVDLEENFHVRFGQSVMRELARTDDEQANLQKALDWMFPALLEFFGPPARANDPQVRLKLKKQTADGLRHDFLAYAVPFLEALGLRVPVHFDEGRGQYILDFPFPSSFDPESKRWDFTTQVGWNSVRQRFKERGPRAKAHLQLIRRAKTHTADWCDS